MEKELNGLNNLNDKSDEEEIVMAKIYIVTDIDIEDMLDNVYAAPPQIFTDKKAAKAYFDEAVENAYEAKAEEELHWEVDKTTEQWEDTLEQVKDRYGMFASSLNCLESFRLENTVIMLQEAYWEPEMN